MRILKIIDQYGWAYFFIDREQQRYSVHEIIIARPEQAILAGVDILFIHSPDISDFARGNLPLIAHKNGIKVIGCYSGQVDFRYSYADLIVTISPQTYAIAKEFGYECPVVFIPEGVDTKFFLPGQFNKDRFKVGWAGRPCAVKRPHLLDRLSFPVHKKAEWGHEYFKEDRVLDSMLEFYHSIDCLVLTSIQECMPRVVMEAMACGLPVVSTDVGSIRMLLDPEMIIPNITDEAELIARFNAILQDLHSGQLNREQIGLDNRLRLEYFSAEVLACFWDFVFKSLSAGRITNNEIKIIAHTCGVPCLE